MKEPKYQIFDHETILSGVVKKNVNRARVDLATANRTTVDNSTEVMIELITDNFTYAIECVNAGNYKDAYDVLLLAYDSMETVDNIEHDTNRQISMLIAETRGVLNVMIQQFC